MKITALAGGLGASKLLEGLRHVMPEEDLMIIVNTGDDIKMLGLYIAPDLDIVTYTLAGIVNPATGWGLTGDTFDCLGMLKQYAGEQWFNLGDQDLATHIYRTQQMRAGIPLSQVADEIRRAHGVKASLLPTTDTHTPATILTDEGDLHFQEYLVKRRAQPKVKGLRFENIGRAAPAPGVAEAILTADAIIICPSNPLIGIGSILAVPGLRDLLQQTPATVAAISPVVGGTSLKGPIDRMLADLGMEVSAAQVARMYADMLDVYVLDQQDADAKADIEQSALQVAVMRDVAAKQALAHATLEAFRQCATS
ncbi:MAG: 2-phospho-L-lactate transferase [Blastocatellia bacterium]